MGKAVSSEAKQQVLKMLQQGMRAWQFNKKKIPLFRVRLAVKCYFFQFDISRYMIYSLE